MQEGVATAEWQPALPLFDDILSILLSNNHQT